MPVRVPPYGEVRRVGALTWQVIGPVRTSSAARHPEEGTGANNASLVLLVQVAGVRLLLAGDMEPEAQQALARSLPGLRADVLKVPHHGSRYQDPELLASLHARLAVVSVGRDNDYGHPAPVDDGAAPPGRDAGASGPTRTGTSRSPCRTGGWGCSTRGGR